MPELDDLKEQKCVGYTKGVSAQEFKWLTLLAAAERGRAKDVFEGLVNSEMDRNEAVILAGNAALLTDQDMEKLEAENNRACADFAKLLPSGLKRVARLAVTPRFPRGCGQTAFYVVLTKIKETTDGEEEDLVAKFNKSLYIRKSENPRDFAERLEHIAESLEEFHGVHKTDAELIDQILCAAWDNEILADTAKCIKREGKEDP